MNPGPPVSPDPAGSRPSSGPVRRYDGTAGAAPAPVRTARWREQFVAGGWMVLMWSLLWGDFHLGNLVGGALVATAVLVFFPLPPVTLDIRLRPGRVLNVLVRFVVELVGASAQVARVALRPGYEPRSAIVGVRLRVCTDLNLALTAVAVSLVPGTLILEIDRTSGTLFVHVFDVRDPADLQRRRQHVLTVERRLVRAVGSAAEVRLLAPPDRPAPDHPRPESPPTDPEGPAR